MVRCTTNIMYMYMYNALSYLERTDILRGFIEVLVKVTLKRERDEEEDSSIKH